MPPGSSELLTFLIADIRDYARFAQERGDEAAVELSETFAHIVRELVESHDGTVFELHGDEALCVFRSPRQCLRAAVALQRRFVQETVESPDSPMTVGIGIDAGAAVHGPDGYRGGALDLAARLCAQAGAGQVLASPEVTRLAGAIVGVGYDVLEGTALTGSDESIRPVRVVPDDADPAEQLIACASSVRAATSARATAARAHRGAPTRTDPIGATAKGVPVPATELVGRAPDLSAARDLLTAAAVRLVTITGAPGVGKTRLAQALAAAVADEFADGVGWVELAPVRDPGQIIAEIARALGIGERAPDIAVGPVADALAGQEVLVVLDNCEHLLDGVAEIGELLAASPRLRILATSRERLHLTAEREYPLPPLPMPAGMEPTDLDKLRENPAISLLLARAPAGVQLTTRTSQALSDICVRLDGLPLAIELAAARLRVFTPSELAFRLEHNAASLASAARDLPGRHRDILSAIEWSHDLLPDNERVVFRRSSVFVGSWTLADAIAINPAMAEYDVVAAVESLLDKSLVRRTDVTAGDGQEARFSYLFSVREYAAARLADSGEADDAKQSHMRHFAAVAVDWERTVGTPDEALTFAWTEYTRLDLLAALEFAREQEDWAAECRLATALGWYWYTRGSLTAVAGIREVVARVTDEHPAEVDLLAAALVSSGVVSVGLGDHDAAEQDLVRAVEICGRIGDTRRLAIANAFLGHAMRGRGEYASAADHYGTARSLWVGVDSRRGMAWSAHDLGILAYETGDYPTAENYLREALLGFRELEYEWAVAVSACGLGTVLIAEQRPHQAAQLLGEALVIHDAVADRRGVAQCLESLAALAVLRADAATAGRLLGAADAWRTAAAARPSHAEERRIALLDESIIRTLGRGPADAERLAGRRVPPVASIALAAAFAAGAAGRPHDEAGELTARQREVATLVAAGQTNRQIGRALGISEKTAEVHVRNIMERLATPSRAGVAAWAASRGLTRPTG